MHFKDEIFHFFLQKKMSEGKVLMEQKMSRQINFDAEIEEEV